MSKLSQIDEDLIPRQQDGRAKVLRLHSRHTRHPENVHSLLRDQALKTSPTIDPSQKDWLLILWEAGSGRKHYCDIRGNYSKAVKERNEIMESGDYEKAWLFEKRVDS